MEKIRFIITLALYLLITGCQDELTRENHDACFSMTISNALPVQFWLNGEESYNEKEVCGVTKICFNQPFQCDDEIGAQFKSREDDQFLLRVLDSGDSLILDIPFDQTVFESEDFMERYPLEDWVNGTGSGPAWTLGNNPFVATSGIQNARPLSIPVSGILPGTYELKYANNFSGDGISSSIQFRKNGVNIGSSGLSDSNGSVNTTSITLTDVPDEVRITVLSVTASARTTTMYSLELRTNDYIYSVILVPGSVGVCNQEVRLKIIKDGSPDEEIAYSDLLSIRTEHPCTLAIDYTNNKDFYGITYQDVSPQPTFRLRIPAIFFEEDNPAEQEDHELSSGEIVRLYNKLEQRRKLDIGFLPNYMHRKLQLVLMHDVVSIDDKEWIRREAYERVEGNKRYPLKRASVWLHDKNYIKENQL